MRNIRWVGAVTLSLVALLGAPVLASFGGMWFLVNGSNVQCGAEVVGDGLNFITLDIRIYGPSGALLKRDAVAQDSSQQLDLNLNVYTPQVGSGTYRCWVEWHDGWTTDVEEDYLGIP
jgi:hypothetical protein